jgi:hypothetical protein
MLFVFAQHLAICIAGCLSRNTVILAAPLVFNTTPAVSSMMPLTFLVRSSSFSPSTPNKMSTDLHVYRSTCLQVYMFTGLHVYRSTCLQVYMSTGLHVYMSTGLHVYMSTGLHVYMSTGRHVYRSTCLQVYIS